MNINFSTTTITTAILAVLLIALSLNVSRLRMKHRATYGDAGQKDLMMAIRAHGNTLEQSLLFVALLASAQWAGALGLSVLASVAGIFIVARVLYAVAVFRRNLKLRQLAHALSVLLQLALCVAILVRGLT